MDMHLTAEQLRAVARGETSLAETAAIGAHARTCDDCARRILEVKSSASVRRAIETADVEVLPPRNRWLAIAATIAVALLGAAIFFAMRGRRADAPRQEAIQQPASAPPVQTTASAVAETPRDYGRAEWSAAVQTALATGTIAVADLGALTRPGGELRGPGGEPATPHGMHPVAEVTESATPEFSWNATAGATYVVLVATPDGDVLESPPLDQPRWRIAEPLRSGVTYSWQVQVTSGDREVLIPTPPDPPAFFRVAPGNVRDELRAARAQFPGDHLLIATIAAKHGLLTPAREALERHLAQHPTADAAKLRASLASRP